MDLKRIRQIMDWFAGSGLLHFEVSEGESRIRLERAATVGAPLQAETRAAPSPEPVSETSMLSVEAPIYGICYLSPSPDAGPFVQSGQSVRAGDTLCIVEAMKVLNPVTAPCDARVARIEAIDGSEVEEGQILMVLE